MISQGNTFLILHEKLLCLDNNLSSSTLPDQWSATKKKKKKTRIATFICTYMYIYIINLFLYISFLTGSGAADGLEVALSWKFSSNFNGVANAINVNCFYCSAAFWIWVLCSCRHERETSGQVCQWNWTSVSYLRFPKLGLHHHGKEHHRQHCSEIDRLNHGSRRRCSRKKKKVDFLLSFWVGMNWNFTELHALINIYIYTDMVLGLVGKVASVLRGDQNLHD